MSVQICPACQKDLDPTDDSIYCEACGANIMKPPALTGPWDVRMGAATYRVTASTRSEAMELARDLYRKTIGQPMPIPSANRVVER